ncbi:unnamed protein product [Phyllotreta striolata]|uniref:Histone-lysine N-methyltransferase n=1 Tax=Phyllotreta striolata TaxID=444603 RepID=A0A9N9XNE7_PHYSR|nr:unnamed protein product [Phyllotreta striolata]
MDYPEISSFTPDQRNAHEQDLSITVSSSKVINSRTAINNGTVKNVAQEKSIEMKEAISIAPTVRFRNEIQRNICIKLERVQFDRIGRITWPRTLQGIKVQIYKTKKPRRRTNADGSLVSTYSKEFVVEKILDQTYDASTKSHMFLVKWQGYPMEKNTWEPVEHLRNSPLALSKFLAEKLGAEVLEALCQKLEFSEQDLKETLQEVDLNRLPDKLALQSHLFNMLMSPIRVTHVRKLKHGRKVMALYRLVLLRETQLSELRSWEHSINMLDKSDHHIKIENLVDLEGPPKGFVYINESLMSADLKVSFPPYSGCECLECDPNRDKECCGRSSNNLINYNNRRRVNVNPGTAIYECNKKCKCPASCRNRCVQNGRTIPLCIFRTSNGCGWGLKTLRKIGCGSFVCEYVGEIVTHEEAEKRGKIYDAEGRTYLFDLDYHTKDNPYTIDAAKFGNVSHFINHSCDPNLAVYAVWIDCLDPNLPRLAFFALREIQKDEELTFDYMMNIDPVAPTTPEKARFLCTPDKMDDSLRSDKSLCKCAADTCRRYLF